MLQNVRLVLRDRSNARLKIHKCKLEFICRDNSASQEG